MSESKVIQFDKKRLPINIRKDTSFCRHMHVVVCEKTRMLECEKCQTMLDPFDYLWQWANKDRNLSWTRDALEKDIESLSTELKEMKRDERNTRSRLKRLDKI